jgi:hypothetical protein
MNTREENTPVETADCDACLKKTPSRPPNKAFWGAIVAFWVASIALGFGTASPYGWGLVAALAWSSLAVSVFLFARRAATWTCSECGSTVAPPVYARHLPKAGAYRAAQPRHA